MMPGKRSYPLTIAVAFLVLIIVNGIASRFHKRLDLTANQRYTLSEASKDIIRKIESPVVIDVLLGGNVPSEFKTLQKETRYVLEEFNTINSAIKFNFTDPLEDQIIADETIDQLQQLGLTPTSITSEEGGKFSQELLFPWALANYGAKTVRVPLLKNKLGATTEERITNSVQALEYAFTDAFVKLTLEERKKIAILKGNGELEDIYITDFLSTLKSYYNIAPFTLDSVAVNPEKTLHELREFQLVLIAKPTTAFTNKEKYVLDQYLLNGGTLLWLVDKVAVEIEDLYNETGKTLALPRDLNLDDLFFKYGIRVNPVLVNDLYFTQIVLATGEGNDAQYNPVPWLYSPMVFPANTHPINTNTEALRFQFANAIDTLPNTINKTVLLSSSPLSKPITTPTEISLDIIRQQPDKATYTKGGMPMAVLLEGRFTSVFKNRVKPFTISDAKAEGEETKLIVISDGDLIKNDLRNGQPLELGYDKWTNNFYGNKEFLLNCVNYLLDDTGVINIRSKALQLAFLDSKKVARKKGFWQFVTIGSPIVIVLISGWLFQWYRKRKYAV